MLAVFSVKKAVKFIRLLASCAALFLLPACDSLWPFSEKANYTIVSSGNKNLDDYLQKVIDDRLEEELEESENPEINARRESYREQMIKADLVKAMHAKGYYDGKVEYSDRNEKFTGTYTVQTGEKFLISSIAVEPVRFQEFLDKSTVFAGQLLDAEAVLLQQKKLRDSIQKDRCYFSLDVNNAVALDKQHKTGALTYNVKAGQEGYFDTLQFTGAPNVRLSYLNKLVPWKKGDCYRQSKIEDLKTALLESGLFTRAEAVLPEAPAADGAVPVTIALTERAPRTVKTGASYYSDEGLGTIFGWEHRNFFGAAEKVNIDLALSQLKQSLSATLQKPYFLRKDQSLSLNSELRRQDTDAFEEIAIDLGADISRKLTEHLNGTGGVAFTLSQIDEKNDLNEENNFYALFSTPFSLSYDNRNNKLNPYKGWLLTASAEPFLDVLGESDPFFKTQAGASTYYAFDENAYYVLAARAGIGSILGSGVFTIPPTERFYAGGGGSVRGYGYQEVGPKDEDGDPTGGRSTATGSTEFRIKFTDKIGAVAFVDAGSVSENIAPDFQNLAIGAGVGARYYTDFGPLRFDIATPLTQKEDLDQNYQFYISIGQAF